MIWHTNYMVFQILMMVLILTLPVLGVNTQCVKWMIPGHHNAKEGKIGFYLALIIFLCKNIDKQLNICLNVYIKRQNDSNDLIAKSAESMFRKQSVTKRNEEDIFYEKNISDRGGLRGMRIEDGGSDEEGRGREGCDGFLYDAENEGGI